MPLFWLLPCFKKGNAWRQEIVSNYLRDISLCVAPTTWADLVAFYRLHPLIPKSFFSIELKKFRNERK